MIADNRLVADDPTLVLSQFEGKLWHGRENTPPAVEITRVLSGCGGLVVGGRLDAYAPGDLYCFGGGLAYRTSRSDAATTTPQTTIVRSLRFQPERFGSLFWSLPENRAVDHFLARAASGLRFPESVGSGLIDQFDRLWHERGPRRLSRLLELLADMANEPAAEALADPSPLIGLRRETERINRAVGFIHDHLTEPIRLADVADAVGLSAQRFSRIFRRRTGHSFVGYLGAQRIELACRYLAETEQNVASICYACGFNNLSNFNRHFLRQKGVPPRDFRRCKLSRDTATDAPTTSAALGRDAERVA